MTRYFFQRPRKFLCRLVSVTLILAPSFAMTEEPRFAGQDAAVGEIRVSLLKPDDFVALYGPDWRLMDGGNDVSGLAISSYLDPTIQSKDKRFVLPDARGKFLRMANNGATGNLYDPEERVTGSIQSHGFPKHSHSLVFRSNGWPKQSGHRYSNRNYILDKDAPSGSRNPDKNLKYTTSTSGSLKETRPVNLAVNYYLRVSCTTGGICKPTSVESD